MSLSRVQSVPRVILSFFNVYLPNIVYFGFIRGIGRSTAPPIVDFMPANRYHLTGIRSKCTKCRWSEMWTEQNIEKFEIPTD